ncbi:PGPGW domain-containing protein [Thalassolituus sp. LLYu03]|uniref:PGPGW domain-containing protein n=1 Tax=Thalassolituus sp. LLYu03 TaxID=3421656 RepID=UPI003D27A9A5
MIRRSIHSIAGFLLVIAGIIITPMPIPLGIILIILGLSMLASSVPAVRHFLRDTRGRYRVFSARLNHMKPRLPAFARRLIEDTDPDLP